MILLMMFFPVPVCRGVLILKSSIDINKTPDFECTSFRLFFLIAKFVKNCFQQKQKSVSFIVQFLLFFLKSSVTEVWETVWLHLVFLSLWLCCATLSSVDLPWEKKICCSCSGKAKHKMRDWCCSALTWEWTGL